MKWIDLLALADGGGRLLAAWCWQSALLLGLIWLLQKLYRPGMPAARSRIWLSGLVAVAVLPLWMTLGQRVPLPRPPGAAFSRPFNTVSGDTSSATLSESSSGNSNAAAPSSAAISATANSVWRLVFACWLVGALITLARLWRSYHSLRRTRARARIVTISELECPDRERVELSRRSVRLGLSEEISSPVLLGLFHPTILFPADILAWTSSEERELMFNHELAHLRRRDHYVNFFQRLLGAVLFFNPLVRSANHRLSLESELACDEQVLIEGAKASVYAESLLKVVERNLFKSALFEPTYFSSKQTLERRIEMLFQRNGAQPLRGRWPYLAVSLVLIGAMLWLLLPGQRAIAEGRLGQLLSAQTGGVESELMTLEREWLAAMNRFDAAALDGMMSDDYTFTNMPGKVSTKAQQLDGLKAKDNPARASGWTMEYDDIAVRVYGDTAVVTGRATIKAKKDSWQYRYTRVWVKRGGRWQAVTTALTRIED